MSFLRLKKRKQSGQTLIETMVAVFILAMGITAAVGLAIFALSSATQVIRQIIATGLAREGVEAVKNMRDTNWLKIPTIDTNCYNYDTGASDAKCYKNWLNPGGVDTFDINPPSGNKSYVLTFNPTINKFWQLSQQNNKYGLDFDTDISGLNFQGFFKPNTTSNYGSSDFYRKITLRTDGANSSAPFNTNVGPRLQVISQVWWTGKNCPRTADWPGLNKCSVEIQTFLTNWKNY